MLNDDCTGEGFCLTEDRSDFVGGSCTARCDDAVDPDSCGAAATCVDTVCFPRCTEEADCRTGYTCQDTYVLSPSPGGRVCVPRDPSTADGTPCQRNFECGPVSGCFSNGVHGYCQALCFADSDCGSDGLCYRLPQLDADEPGFCVQRCEYAQDCVIGERCFATSDATDAPRACFIPAEPENVARVGTPCTPDGNERDDAACGTAPEQICLGFAGGAVCSVVGCTVDAQARESSCGDGFSSCVGFGDQDFCLPLCILGAGDDQCSPGFLCWANEFGAQCLPPACESSADCDSGQYCHESGQCLTAGLPGAQVGDPCAEDTDCPRNGYCTGSASGGYCYIPNCAAGGDFACPSADDVCLPEIKRGFIPSACLRGCASDADCRQAEGHRCSEFIAGEPKVCLPS
jgi:hypothetical protein